MKARRTIAGALVGIAAAIASSSTVTTTATIVGSATAVTVLTASEAGAQDCTGACRRGRIVREAPASSKVGPFASKVKVHPL